MKPWDNQAWATVMEETVRGKKRLRWEKQEVKEWPTDTEMHDFLGMVDVLLGYQWQKLTGDKPWM